MRLQKLRRTKKDKEELKACITKRTPVGQKKHDLIRPYICLATGFEPCHFSKTSIPHL
jgi:hypothetical protein